MKLPFLILFVYLSCVSSADVNDKDYQFNHPPSPEIINVAVIYEDVTQKPIQIENNKKETSEITEQNTPVSQVGEDYSSPKDIVRPTLVPKPRSLSNFQIPVAVVYENEDSKMQSVTKPRSKVLRRRLKQRRQQTTKQPRNEETNESVTEIGTTQNVIQSTETYVPSVPRKVNVKNRERDPFVPIIESENYVYGHNGNFHYSYEGGDGTRAFSEGQLKTVNDDAAGEAVVGGFSYKDKDGNDFSLSYTADENGYRPVGTHLPTPPPIPPAIARALAYLATATTPEPVTKSLN